MPEQAYTPPSIKDVLPVKELISAIKGEPFRGMSVLWRMKGKEIKEKKLLGTAYLPIDDEQEYVLLTEAKLTGADEIDLQNDILTDYGIGLVFYKSILPNITLSRAKIAGLCFWNSQSGYIRIDSHSQSGDISIDNNSRLGGIGINDNSQSGDIWINDNSHSGGIRIEDNSQSGNIRIENNSQSGYIWIAGNSQVVDIWITDNSQSGYISIVSNSQSGNMWILENSQSGNIRIADESQSGDIKIDKNTKALAITIIGNSQTGNLSFTNALLSKVSISGNHFGISLYNTAFLLFKISDCLVRNLEWQTGTKGELYISQSKVLHLQVANTTLLKDSLLSLSDTELHYGILQEVLVQGSLLLRKLGPPLQPFAWQDIAKNLEVEPGGAQQQKLWNREEKLFEERKSEYHQEAGALAKQYGPTPIFRITHSSLGKTEITGCDFSAFQFQYYNSNLLGCFITGTQLPKRNMVIYDPVADKVLNNQSHSHALFEQKTAVYNQFKKIYENQGDVVEASVFHAQAMRWEQKLLWRQFRHDKEGFWKKVKLFFENIGFRLNWFSNNHGESWLVALVFTIGVGLVFFTASIWGLTHWGDGKTWWDNIHKLPGFMLPTHSYDYLSKDIVETPKAAYPNLKVNLWHTTWDFLGRIFIGYGIFQFISAFRRHGKKGG